MNDRARFYLWLLLVLLVILLLVSCGVEGSRAWDGTGKAVAVSYDDPDDWDTHSSTCWSYDKNNNCTFRTYDTEHHHDPAHWYVTVQDSFWADRHTIEVSEDVYNGCRRVNAPFSSGRCHG